MLSFEFTTHSYGETLAAAARLAKCCEGGAFIALCGGMGSGKTAFARGIAGYFGHNASSPTFAIVNEYRQGLLHFDLYRLKDVNELYETGYEWDCYDGIVVMEWADMFYDELPVDKLTVNISQAGENTRGFAVTAGGARSREILERFMDDRTGD